MPCEEMVIKIIGIICLVFISFIAYLPIKKSPIDKFGEGKTFEETTVIGELKRKTLFKQIANFFIVIIMVTTIISNAIIPETISDQVTLVIFIACITSLGIKIGIDISK